MANHEATATPWAHRAVIAAPFYAIGLVCIGVYSHPWVAFGVWAVLTGFRYERG